MGLDFEKQAGDMIVELVCGLLGLFSANGRNCVITTTRYIISYIRAVGEESAPVRRLPRQHGDRIKQHNAIDHHNF